jgi:hypothetical protein
MKRRYVGNTAPALLGLRVRRFVGDAEMFWPTHHIEGQFENVRADYVVQHKLHVRQ